MIIGYELPLSEAETYLLKAEAIKFGDPAEILKLAENAAAAAERSGDLKTYALALYYLSWAFTVQGCYESSLLHAIEALMIAREHHYLDIELLSVNVIAINFTICHLVTEGTFLFEHQLKLTEKLPEPRLKFCVLNDFSILKADEGKYQTAIELGRQALTYLSPEKFPTDSQYCSMINSNIANFMINLGQFDNALVYAYDCLHHAKLAQSQNLLLLAYATISGIYLDKGDIEKAYQYLHLAEQEVNPKVLLGTRFPLTTVQARIYQYEQRYSEAVRAWEDAYTQSVQLYELELAKEALDNLKVIYEQLNDTHGLMSTYRRLAEDLPNLRNSGAELRLEVFQMIFSVDAKPTAESSILSQKKKKMLERISHEFRTPLTIIQTSTDLIEMYNDRMTLEQRQSKMRNISHQVKWMTLMLENVVEMMRLEEDTSNVKVELVETSLSELVHKTLSNLKNYQLSSERVQVDAPLDAPPVSIPFQSLRTTLIHLLVNALKFSQAEVVLKISIETDHLHIEVVDQGIGIPAGELETVFEPMERGSNLDEVTGLGMGLAIVKQLVNQMAGEIKLHSTENVGTRVVLVIPCAV